MSRLALSGADNADVLPVDLRLGKANSASEYYSGSDIRDKIRCLVLLILSGAALNFVRVLTQEAAIPLLDAQGCLHVNADEVDRWSHTLVPVEYIAQFAAEVYDNEHVSITGWRSELCFLSASSTLCTVLDLNPSSACDRRPVGLSNPLDHLWILGRKSVDPAKGRTWYKQPRRVPLRS